VVCFTIINDFYYPEQARPMLGFMTLAFAIVPGIAVALGGFITEYLWWQACFYVLLAYGLFLILPAVTLSETITQYDHNALKGRYLFKNYIAMFKNRTLIAYTLIYGLTAACSYIFSAEGPVIGIHVLHYAPGVYGLLGLIPYVGAIAGAYTMINYSAKIKASLVVKLGITFEVTSVAIMLIAFLAHFVNIFTLILPMVLFMLGHAFLVSTCPGIAIAQSNDKANASAVVSFLGIGTAVIGTLCLGLLHFQSVLILPLILSVGMILMVLIYSRLDK
jgi:MFS family permease